MADKYLQISYKIESDLRRMRAEGISRLPTEESFCERYSCSRQTVRSALKVLVDKGLIVKKQGSGSYIAEETKKLQNKVVFITSNRFEYTKPEFTSGLTNALKEQKYKLLCFNTDSSFEKEKEALGEVLSVYPAAVLIEPSSNVIPNPNLPLIEEISKKGIPVIYLFSSYSVPKDSICIKEDDLIGAYKLVSHLKERGHKKTCSIFRCDDTRGLERYKGYMEACKEYGLEFDKHNAFFFTERDRKNMIKGNDDFLKSFIDEIDQDCTAVVCQNDEVAFRLIKLMEKRGISVPKDLSVVSFENSYYSSDMADITSLGQSDKELIRVTSETVLAAIEHRTVKPEPIGWKLHVRNSG